MKAGFFVILHFTCPDYGHERGLWQWFRTRAEFTDALDALGIRPEYCTKLKIQKAGEPEPKEYEPSVLKKLIE